MSALTLEQRVFRNEAYREIQNVMGKYVFFRMYDMLEETTALFSRREDTSIEMPWGVYIGSDAADRCFVADHNAPPEEHLGSMTIHDVCTPVIEIAADCQTARAVWISPGLATAHGPEGKKGLWAWLRYGCDFILEDGVWRIWHMRKCGLFTVPTDKDWTDDDPMSFMRAGTASPPPPPKRSNDAPPTGRFGYRKDGNLDRALLPPEPYETF